MANGQIVYQKGDYIVKKISKGFYLYNRKRINPDEHTHIKTQKTCENLIDMIYKRRIPHSDYLQRSILRICRDKEFVEDVKRKREKDKNKPKYFNSNKGVRK